MNGLRWLRIRCNLSTSELADQLGVTRHVESVVLMQYCGK